MKSFVPISFLLFTTNAFAIFCPTNFSNIEFGDSIEQIQQLCGNPNSINHYKKNLVTNQEWEYYIKAPGLDQSMTKMNVLFKDNQVVNINIVYDSRFFAQVCASKETGKYLRLAQSICSSPYNYQNVASTTICGPIIQVGHTTQTVEMACGKPALAKDIQGSAEPLSTAITEFHYDGPPRVTLIFENGRLADRVFQ